MSDQITHIEAKIGRTSTFLTSIWGVLTIGGTIVAGVLGGYWWLQDTIVERNAAAISHAAIAEIKKEINPLSMAVYREDRRKDSIERLNAELLAIEFMNRMDSLNLVMTSEVTARRTQDRRLGRMEAKLDANSMPRDEDKLARIWEYLKARDSADSTSAQLNEMMREIRRMNEQKIENVKSGDRIR